MVNNDSSADLEQQTIGVAVNDHIYSISAVTTSKKSRTAALDSGRAEARTLPIPGLNHCVCVMVVD
jgi:hypothetical protein